MLFDEQKNIISNLPDGAIILKNDESGRNIQFCNDSLEKMFSPGLQSQQTILVDGDFIQREITTKDILENIYLD
jgi:hypothetical protein